MSDRCPCPCCGHLVLDEMPGSYAICPVRFWEDDGVQFRWPTMDGGANKVSLIDAQRNYQDLAPATSTADSASAHRPRTSRSTPPGAPST
ncbi:MULTISPECIES: CPCC family cysteine-rich protein [Streptomyces]|uniref:CPCC family cysteine-rich protein n=1 Tax=Streptomyces antimycoticus TaxID=68175 RepID=A0ABD5JA16_9ACTN|nr:MULTISPECIES: CPCC family cysteine-rich protein [Streptomyces]MEE4585236.1 CPCC family cysteine-rich protein [Streptomyces sp. DSM 41602]WJD97465.1 CPCC family cysteine-rich protein [Streptomyces antimycoticus]WTA83807.1 CPCC family cysteine-rich protein [Streptomyces antimycoticus]WTB05768.1 CPCC family cysteine-rich protein [Streptomyces antimycoticus]